MRKKLIVYIGSIGLVATLIAGLMLVFLPVGVSITGEGSLSVNTGIALATSEQAPIEFDIRGANGYAKLEPSGCCVYGGKVRLRIDMFLDPSDLYYNIHHILTVDTNWQNNPFHSHFIYIDADTSDKAIKRQIETCLGYFYGFHKACWDADKEFIDEWKKVPIEVGTIRCPLVESDSEDLQACQLRVQDIISRMAEFEIDKKQVVGDFKLPEGEGTIDIGEAATDRPNYFTDGYTIIALDNPANDTGTLDTIEMWLDADSAGVKAGTFYGSSTDYTSRDSHTIGNVTDGSKQTFSGLSIDVTSGDYIGYFSTVDSGKIERNYTGFAGIYYKSGDQFGAGQQTYALVAGDAISLYGTGTIACSPDISNTPSSKDFGAVATSSTPTTGLTHFTVTNNSGGAVTITIKATDWMSPSTVTIDEQVGAGADDYTTYEDTTFRSSWIHGHLGCDKNYYEKECVGARFQTVNVPQGSTISTAYLSFYGKNKLATTFNYSVTIYGVDEDDFTAPTGYAEWAADPHTSATVAWTPGDWGSDYAWVNTPEIKTTVQEVVNRASWVANNDMGFKVVSTQTGVDIDKRVRSWDYDDHSKGAKLHIEYTSTAVGWTHSDTATPGADIAGLKAGLEGTDYTIIVKKTAAYNTLVAGLADSATQKWGLKLYTPTSFSDGVQKTTTVTLTATCD